MKTHPTLATHLARFESALPEPACLLRLARWLIPVSLFAGLVTEPLLRWLLPI